VSQEGNYVGTITPGGSVTEYLVPNGAPFGIQNLTVGADGNLWFTMTGLSFDNNLSVVGKVTTSGTVTSYVIYPNTAVSPTDIVTGVDGALWFVESGVNKIGRLRTTGALTSEYAVNGTGSITSGPDGNLWFTEMSANKVGRMTLSGGVTEFTMPGTTPHPDDITSGPDGNLWVTGNGSNSLIRVTPLGIASVVVGGTGGPGGPIGVTAGPDHSIWTVDNSANKIGKTSYVLGGGQGTTDPYQGFLPPVTFPQQGVQIDASGTVYSPETGDLKIQAPLDFLQHAPD
jgi:virginiamycin B lyase